MRIVCGALVSAFFFCAFPALADDYGPHKDIRDVTFAAKRLLAHRLRDQKIGPATTVISDIVVVKDQALLSWAAGKQTGLMGLIRYADRWWDAFDVTDDQCRFRTTGFPLNAGESHGRLSTVELADIGLHSDVVAAAAAHNLMLRRLTSTLPAMCDFFSTHEKQPIRPAGAVLEPDVVQSAGYQIQLRYVANSASPGAAKIAIRARAPTTGEIIGYPTPPRGAGGSQSVVFLYIDVDSKTPISFEKGSKLSIWLPYVLDDQIEYDLNLYTMRESVGLFKGTIFDNVVTFDLPAFTLQPGETQGEVDGYW